MEEKLHMKTNLIECLSIYYDISLCDHIKSFIMISVPNYVAMTTS